MPILGSAAAGTALGYQVLSLIPAQARDFLLAPFLVLFLILIVLEREPGWNLVLLLVFSISAGSLLNWSNVDVTSWLTWFLFLFLCTGGLTLALRWSTHLPRGLNILSPLSILYLLGWMGIILRVLPGWMRDVWIIAGLLLFTGLAARALGQGFTLPIEESPIPLGIELFLILFNLFWLSGLILTQD